MNPIAASSASCFRALLACWSVVILSTSLSAQPSTGVIAGTVADGNTRQFLNQAEVRIQGTQLVALTDNEGYFRLAGVPAGTQTVLLNYLGLRPGNFSVTVAAGQTVTRAFELKSDEVLKLGEFVVAAEREGQAAAINQQRNADHMKSVVAADAFGSLHDNNAAELLKNIPGIALNYLGEDATGFSMRGEDSTYASITSDGDPMASGANNGPSGRQINFRNITVNNVESVEVHRAPTAAQPANALGGSINFVSKSAFSQKGRRLRFDVGANFNTDAAQLARSYEGPDHEAFTIFPAAQVNYSDSFRHDSGHPIGIVANALLGGRYLHNTAFNRTYAYVPTLAAGQQVTASTPAIANSLIVREAAAGWRQRSLGVNADYKLSDRTTVFLRGSYQEGPQSYMYGLNHSLTMTAANQTSGAGAAMIPINGNSANTIDSRPNTTPVAAGSSTGSRFTKTTGTELADNQLYSFSGGVKQRFGNINLDYSAYYSRAFDRRDPSGTPHIGTFTYDLTNVGFVAENVQDPDRVTLRQTSGADYRNLSNYGRLVWVKDTRFSLDRRWGAKIDAKWQGTAFKVPVLVQGGIADNTQVRITTGVSTGARKWLGAGPDGVFGNANDVPLDLGQFADSRLPNGWVHRGPTATVETGQWLDAAKVWAYVAAHPEAETRDLVLDVTAHKNKKVFMEDIPSAYLMTTVRLGKLSVVPGVRFERTINIGKGWGRAAVPIPAGLPLAAQAALTESQYVRFVRRKSYDGFYPNLQARYSFTPNFILRSAFTDNIGRPNFGQLLPGDAINVTNGTITRNNPELEPFKSRNYDLSAEYYLGKSTGSVTVGVFRRAKSNYFTNVSTILPGGRDNGYDGMYEGYTVTTQENVPGSTRTEGFEFGYRQNLRFMPGLLRNLIATSSYTYLKVQPRPGVLRVTGIFPEVYSGSLAYVSHGLRVDVKYNLRKKWYTAVNNTNGELTYNKDDGRWDLAVDYRFAQRYVAYFNWRNVTRSVADTYIGDRRLNYQTAGSLINVGVRIDL